MKDFLHNYKNILIVLLFSIFVAFMNYLGRIANEKADKKRINKTFSGIVLDHDDYRSFSLKLKQLEPNYNIVISGVTYKLYRCAEIGDTIIKAKIGNECILLKKDTFFTLKCYNM